MYIPSCYDCNVQAVLAQFSTFSFLQCPKCKLELCDNGMPKKLDPPKKEAAKNLPKVTSKVIKQETVGQEAFYLFTGAELWESNVTCKHAQVSLDQFDMLICNECSKEVY